MVTLRGLRRAPRRPQLPGARRRRFRSCRGRTRGRAAPAPRRDSRRPHRESRRGAWRCLFQRRRRRHASPRRPRRLSGRMRAETPPRHAPRRAHPATARQARVRGTARPRSAATRRSGRSRAAAPATAASTAETSRTGPPSGVDRSARRPTTSSARRRLPSPDRRRDRRPFRRSDRPRPSPASRTRLAHGEGMCKIIARRRSGRNRASCSATTAAAAWRRGRASQFFRLE